MFGKSLALHSGVAGPSSERGKCNTSKAEVAAEDPNLTVCSSRSRGGTVNSKALAASRTVSGPTDASSEVYARNRQMSQIAFITRGIPYDQLATSSTASGLNGKLPLPPP